MNTHHSADWRSRGTFHRSLIHWLDLKVLLREKLAVARTAHRAAKPAAGRYFSAMSARDALPQRDRKPVRVFRLGEEPSDDLSNSTTAEERFDMVAMLSERMREFSPTPPNTRGEITVRVIRP